MIPRNFLMLLPGPFLACIAFYLVPGIDYPAAPWMAATMTLMASWWIQEVVPIPVTSLLPLFLFPLFSISDATEVSANYGSPIIFLFLGGFLLAFGLQEAGVHKRIALKVISAIGSSPRKLILGSMTVTAALSMWISNTAAVMVMLPIGMSIIKRIESDPKSETYLENFRICFLLGLSYASSIGGMATIIGTPPNLIYLEMQHRFFPDQAATGFIDWFLVCFPLCAIFLYVGWLIMVRLVFPVPHVEIDREKDEIKAQLLALGPVRRDEIMAVSVFAFAALLWMTGSDINISDNFKIEGWRSLLGIPEFSDSAVAVCAAVLLFLIPSGEKKGKALLNWEVTKELPWGILLLFGGGFAMADGFEISGLSAMTENLFRGLSGLPPLLLLAIVCIVVLIQTEFTSNSAVVTLVLPILASLSSVYNLRPEFLMIPATLAASCAFMLPVATPPQAIVYSLGYMNIRQMMKAGVWFNLIGFILITSAFSVLHLFIWE